MRDRPFLRLILIIPLLSCVADDAVPGAGSTTGGGPTEMSTTAPTSATPPGTGTTGETTTNESTTSVDTTSDESTTAGCMPGFFDESLFGEACFQ